MLLLFSTVSRLSLLRLWVNATKGKHGYVLASVAGNTVNFALSLNTSGSDTTASFFYLSNKVCAIIAC